MSNLIALFSWPFIAAAILFALPTKHLKKLAILFSLLPLLWLIVHHAGWVGSQVSYSWLPPLSVNFHLKVDELTLLFLYLTAIIIPVSLLSSSETAPYPNMIYGLILLLEGLLFGFFMAGDLVMFTIFWEAMLVPLYFLIALWGGKERRIAALKFIVYMIAGSALLIAAVLALYLSASSFNIEELAKTASGSPYAPWICAIFILAFAVKTPLFPFHAWLPDAYTQASTPATILLSAILSKAGIYGFIRIVFSFFPTLAQAWSPWILGLAIFGVFYGAFAAWMQKDYKRLIAYSSFSHVNFILAGLFVFAAPAHTGAILQAFNHGITIASLFLVAGWLEERLGTTQMGQTGGLCKFMPHLCWLTLFFVMSNVGLPGLNNFVGEILILFGLFKENPWLAAILSLSVIIVVVYMLRWMQKMYFGAPSFFQDSWVDIKCKEFLIATPLVLLILWIGIYPQPLLKFIQEIRL